MSISKEHKAQASFEVIGVAGAIVISVAIILSMFTAFTDSTIATGIAKSKFIKATCCGPEKYTLKGIGLTENGDELTITITSLPPVDPASVIGAALKTEIDTNVSSQTKYQKVTVEFG